MKRWRILASSRVTVCCDLRNSVVIVLVRGGNAAIIFTEAGLRFLRVPAFFVAEPAARVHVCCGRPRGVDAVATRAMACGFGTAPGRPDAAGDSRTAVR